MSDGGPGGLLMIGPPEKGGPPSEEGIDDGLPDDLALAGEMSVGEEMSKDFDAGPFNAYARVVFSDSSSPEERTDALRQAIESVLEGFGR